MDLDDLRNRLSITVYPLEAWYFDDAMCRSALEEHFGVKGLSGLGIEDMDQLESGLDRQNLTDTLREKLATIACKAAVKGRQRISREEMEALLDQLLLLENPYRCPHDKYGRNRKVLEIFAEAGAPADILYKSHPHIGTDYLKDVVKNLRKKIREMGGDVLFETKLTDLRLNNGCLEAVCLNDKEWISADILVLAIGHSARDTFEILARAEIPMSAKAFAVGYRVQHAQSFINLRQYGEESPSDLPAADYKLTARTADGRSAYSFCMTSISYSKYLVTTVAKDVSNETVAAVKENSDTLQGVDISEESLRRYTDAECFSSVIGYTGVISTDEYETLSQTNSNYSLNDVVGKAGIEQVMVMTPYTVREKICVTAGDIQAAGFTSDNSYASSGLFDVNGQTVLESKSVFDKLYPASTTKILTAYIALKYGNLDDIVTVTDNAVNLESGSQMCGLKSGDKITLRDILYGMLLYSGNDAAVAVAEHISGSVSAFVDLMNKEASELMATHSHFANPDGLHGGLRDSSDICRG